VRKIVVHGPRQLSLDTFATYARTLEELVLDSVKKMSHSEALRTCLRIKRIEIEECGPRLNVSDFRYLVDHGSLRELRVIGALLPFEKSEMRELVMKGCDDLLVWLPPRFMTWKFSPRQLRPHTRSRPLSMQRGRDGPTPTAGAHVIRGGRSVVRDPRGGCCDDRRSPTRSSHASCTR
jgi:hypothetical protein